MSIFDERVQAAVELSAFSLHQCQSHASRMQRLQMIVASHIYDWVLIIAAAPYLRAVQTFF
jgi:hypothetical protein